MKASSQAGGWKGILIKHGEKGALGIIGALVLWMMFSGLQKEGLKPEKSPTNLASRVENGEKYIFIANKVKLENGGEKFTPKPHDKVLVNGLEPIPIEFYSNLIPDDFPKIAKRDQPLVFPIEDVHATALVVQVALNDPAKVKEQVGKITDRNNKAELEKQKKAAALLLKQQAEELKKQKLQQNQNNATSGEGGGKKNATKGNPLIQPEIGIQQPQAPLVQRTPHPAIQNLTGITSVTRGIAVVTGLIPYKKQLEEFNRKIVEGKDLIPGRKPEDDSPQIAMFIVERAVVVNPSESEDKLAWVNVTDESQKFFAQYGKQLSKSDDPVVASLLGPQTVGLPKKNIPQWFTVSPLPTLADRKWQREVTHPRIPLFTDLTVEEIVIEQANAFMPVAPAADAGGFGQPAPVVGPAGPTEIELPEYVLLRHIDFNVAPGQTYRYRVTVAYINPNVGLDSKYIGDVAVTDVLPTTPSRASNSVSLAPLHQLLAGGDLNYPSPKRYDDVAKSRVWQWLIDTDKEKKRGGGEVAKDFAGVAVGDLLEFVGTVKNNLNRAAGQPEELVEYNFTTHKIPAPTQMSYLVDVFGKEAPPPPRPKPLVPGAPPVAAPPVPEQPREQLYSEILYVDQDGKLRTSTSPYAETIIDNYKLRYESTPATTGNPGGGGEGLAPPRQPGAEILFKGAEMRGKTQTR